MRWLAVREQRALHRFWAAPYGDAPTARERRAVNRLYQHWERKYYRLMRALSPEAQRASLERGRRCR